MQHFVDGTRGRPEVHAVRVFLELAQGEPAGALPHPVAPGAAAHGEIDDPVRSPQPFVGHVGHSVAPGASPKPHVVERGHVHLGRRRPAQDGAQPDQDLPLRRPGPGVEHGGGPAGDAAHREPPKRLVAVGLFQGGEPGQDHMGVAAGLVEIVVDADHGIEQRQRPIQMAGVGSG